jgi:glycosyltransferase involved in cell wall biosynthesis
MAAPLRIAVFATSLPPLHADGSVREGERFGGVQRACWHLTRELAARGHDVWLFAGGLGPDLDLRAGPPDAFGPGAWHVRFSRPRLRVGHAAIAPGLFRDPGRHLGSAGVDVVVAYMGDQPAPTAALHWARRWKVPLAVSYHGDPVAGFGSLPRRAAVGLHEHWLGPRVLRAADAILALSEPAARSSRLVAAHAAKTHLVPNGVPAGPATPLDRAEARAAHGLPAEAGVVLFVGSLTPIKGVDVLLEAVTRLPDAVVVLVGHGSHAEEYRAQAARLGLADRVRFLGFVTEQAKAELLAAADLLAMPSRSEAFPLTLLEAGIAGLPAVASRLPVLEPLVQDGRSGRLVPVGDAEALAEALGALLADAGTRRRMGEVARTWAQGFTWPEVARKTEAVLLGLVRPGRAAAAPAPASRHPPR